MVTINEESIAWSYNHTGAINKSYIHITTLAQLISFNVTYSLDWITYMIQSKLLNIIILPDENVETFRWTFSINK